MSEPLDLDRETAEYAAAQVREYSKWEAAELITVGNSPAYNVGDPVPISNVDRLGYAERGQVRPQLTYVEGNPDDPDVQTFLSYVDKYPDTPSARSWAAFRAARDADQPGEQLPPLTFGGEKKAPRKVAAAKAEPKTDESKKG